jgi:hypothetical protein
VKTLKYLRLTRDVENPAPDRRLKDWDRKPTIPAGTTLVLLEFDYTVDPAHPAVGRELRRKHNAGSGVGQRRPLFQALLDACEDREPTVQEMVAERDLYPDDVLTHLHQTGVLTAEVLDVIRDRLFGELAAERGG